MPVQGISANQLKRHLGVTYKTSWYLCHRIRKAMSEPDTDKIVIDGAPRYKGLIPKDKHIRGNHFAEIRTSSVLSNRTIKGAFSLLKRGIVGQYHHIGVEHIDAYLSEFSWRFNRRGNQAEMFGVVLSNLATNQPLPYKQLTAKSESELPPF